MGPRSSANPLMLKMYKNKEVKFGKKIGVEGRIPLNNPSMT